MVHGETVAGARRGESKSEMDRGKFVMRREGSSIYILMFVRMYVMDGPFFFPFFWGTLYQFSFG